MTRVAIFFITLFAASGAWAQKNEFLIPCQDAPKEAVLSLPDPISSWGTVHCTIYGHLIAARDGYIWSFPGALAPVHLPAQMVRSDPKEVGNTVYFVNVSVETLSPAESEKINDEFTKGLSVRRDTAEHVYRLTAKNNSGGQHIAYFLVFSNSNVWGLWCNEQCGRTPPFMVLNMQQRPR
jgi:hypothetical protein